VNTSGLVVLLALLLLLGGGIATWIRAEGTPPALELPEALVVGRTGGTLALAASDAGSGLRSLDLRIRHAAGEIPLLAEAFPGNLISGGVRSEHSAEIQLRPDSLAALEGDAVLVATSRDWSWRQLLSGNETVVEVPFTLDLDPPRVTVSTGLTYVRQGGSGAVAYRISEPTVADGVRVGEHFYRGFPLPGGLAGERIALFAVPSEVRGATPEVVARDAAGNEGTASWPVVVKPQSQPKGTVNLPQSFLTRVVPRLAGNTGETDLAALFHDVNTRLRAENEVRVRELLEDSAQTPYFERGLSQLRNSQVTSRFAEQRTYLVDGKAVSSATHYGYDLASTAAAPITAAGPGKVAFAGELGIYGNCVLLDHGLGLATLYGHLSRLDVKAGDPVRQGDTLGLSGATGLAGGDHLHFAVVVGDTYVDPIEWWDDKWVQTHVMARFEPPLP
jgi:murein DD-endopeptidase MepM/ murein hydrolase activator NlpD